MQAQWLIPFWQPPNNEILEKIFHSKMSNLKPSVHLSEQTLNVFLIVHITRMSQILNFIICSIHLRSTHPDSIVHLLDYQAGNISNDLFCINNNVSAYEIAKGFRKPLEARQDTCLLPQYLPNVHDEVVVNRKLNLILFFHAISSTPIKISDMVQVYIKRCLDKLGKWTQPHVVLSIDPNSSSIPVPGACHTPVTLRLEMFPLPSWMNSCRFRY